MKMFAGMGLGGEASGGAGDFDLQPMMTHMLQSILSKDILYPSLKEVSEKVVQLILILPDNFRIIRVFRSSILSISTKTARS